MTDNHALNLRLIGHQFTGNPDLTEQERTTLFAAADELDRLNRIIVALGVTLVETIEELAE